MAKVDIISGIYTDNASDFRVSYPKNMFVIPLDTGTSEGYLRPADGIVLQGTGPGIDRGGINWQGICYRVMGTKLVTIDTAGTVTTLADVGAGGQVTMDYSFQYLAIASGTRLYYYASNVLTQVTDADLGPVIDFVWVDGYFMTTDGTSLIVTELNDPFSVNPLKYGSSEVDPDPVIGLTKLRDEVYAVNRYTIEVFQNIGGDFFPFQRIPGAMMERGSVGTFAFCVYLENIAFVGSGRNEAPAVWIGSNGATTNISTRAIDQILAGYPESVLSKIVLESRITSAQKLLYIHLPDQTLVYDGAASQVLQRPVWIVLASSVVGINTYRARNFVWCYDKWLSGDPLTPAIGYFTNLVSSHYGTTIGWEFATPIMYNGGNTAVFSELELVCLTGRVALGVNPTAWTSYTIDGYTWSQEKPRSLGMQGNTLKRITWFNQGFMRNWRCQKFRGTSDSLLSVSRLEMTVT